MQIAIEEIESYPLEFTDHVRKNMWNFESLVDENDLFNTKACLRDGIREYRPGTEEYKFFLTSLDLLGKHSLIAYHSTRLLDTGTMFKSGLQVLEFEAHWQRLYNVLTEHGLPMTRIETARAKLLRMYNGALGKREGLICLFGPVCLLYGESRMGGFDIMAQNYGGEIAQRAFEASMPDVWNVLAHVGTPYIVKADLSYAQISDGFGFDRENIATEMIMMILYRDYFHLQYQPSFTVHLHESIPASNIISIEPIEVLNI